jgi:hypothetical protein
MFMKGGEDKGPIALKEAETPMMLGKVKVDFADSKGLENPHGVGNGYFKSYFDHKMRADLLTKEERVIMGSAIIGKEISTFDNKTKLDVIEGVLLATPSVREKLANEIPKKTLGVEFKHILDSQESWDMAAGFAVNIALRLGEDGKFKYPSHVRLHDTDEEGGGQTIDLDRIKELVDDINKLFKESAKVRAWFKEDTGMEWGVKRETEEFKKLSHR